VTITFLRVARQATGISVKRYLIVGLAAVASTVGLGLIFAAGADGTSIPDVHVALPPPLSIPCDNGVKGDITAWHWYSYMGEITSAHGVNVLHHLQVVYGKPI
jgi:hypothetical protein